MWVRGLFCQWVVLVTWSQICRSVETETEKALHPEDAGSHQERREKAKQEKKTRKWAKNTREVGLHKREAERGPSARIKQGSQQKKNRRRSHKQAMLSLLMVVSSHCGATGGAATPCPVMQGKSGTRNTQKACNQKPHHPCAPEGVPMREGEKKVNSEDGRQGDAWEGHALKSHCSAPEHTAKAQGKSKPAGGGQQSPSGLSEKTS